MAVIFDSRPSVQRWRDEETGRFAKGPTLVEWVGEVTHRLANRKKAGTSYDISFVSLLLAEGDEPREEDFLAVTQAEIGANRIAYGVKSFQRME